MMVIRTPEMALAEGGLVATNRHQQLQIAVRKVLLLLLFNVYFESARAAWHVAATELALKIKERLGAAEPWFQYWLLTDVQMMAVRPWLLPNIRWSITDSLERHNRDWMHATKNGTINDPERKQFMLVPEHQYVENPATVADTIYGILIELLDHPDLPQRLKEWGGVADEEIQPTMEELRNDQTELEVLLKQG